MTRRLLIACAACAAWVLSACSHQPPTPDWRMNAHGALERGVAAYLSGDTRVAELEFARSRAEVARTGRVDLVARAELVRCAAQWASLVDEPCAGFEPLRADAAPAEQAYADFLRGPVDAGRAALLPVQQHAIAASAATSASDLAAMQAMTDPVSRLVAAAVSLRSGRANATVVDLAVQTASDQGWRRPLLAWLGVARRLATEAGDLALAERLGRRIQLVLDGPATAR
ncbi:MAG: hypothetical protein IPP87_07270 [Ideonella sp.]|jgi:hypothetical protein|nr:hypothetical protein [Ideonella sp.]MBL0148529.1 hypothetical protein [Ideonella sp.]